MNNNLAISERHRQEGNKCFVSSKHEGIAPSVKRSRLQQSIIHYNKALRDSTCNDESASALKNLARANWETGKTIDDKTANVLEKRYYFDNSLKCYFKTVQAGQHCKSIEWLNEIANCQSSCLMEAWEIVSMLPIQERLGYMETCTRHLQDDNYLAQFFIKSSSLLFQHAVVALDKNDFKSSLNYLAECNHPIEEAGRLGKNDPYLVSEHNVLVEDIRLQHATAKSVQAITTGDDLLQMVLNDLENLNMAMIMDIIDWYHQAVILARDVEVEQEAIASCCLGKVFGQVLCIQYRAKKYYKHCMELALAMAPRVVTSTTWYRTAAEMLQKYQRESTSEQERIEEEKKARYLEEYKTQLEEVKTIQKTYKGKDSEILRHLYKAFPPKNPCHTLPKAEHLKKMDLKGLKKVFLKACIHYHPDKQDVSKYGEGWKVFCGEVVKVFTSIYEHYKLG